ncbi:MAG: dual specificity protein phosphatase family protein [Zavarzinella sp.]
MSQPGNFSWISEHVAGCAYPYDVESLVWLREQGIDIVITLTEDPLPKQEIDDAGLMSVHIPIPDMHAPTVEELRQAVGVIEKAITNQRKVVVHCRAGIGRTGTILAAHLIQAGDSPREAITKIRQLRPGSIEVVEQEDILYRFAN